MAGADTGATEKFQYIARGYWIGIVKDLNLVNPALSDWSGDAASSSLNVTMLVSYAVIGETDLIADR